MSSNVSRSDKSVYVSKRKKRTFGERLSDTCIHYNQSIVQTNIYDEREVGLNNHTNHSFAHFDHTDHRECQETGNLHTDINTDTTSFNHSKLFDTCISDVTFDSAITPNINQRIQEQIHHSIQFHAREKAKLYLQSQQTFRNRQPSIESGAGKHFTVNKRNGVPLHTMASLHEELIMSTHPADEDEYFLGEIDGEESEVGELNKIRPAYSLGGEVGKELLPLSLSPIQHGWDNYLAPHSTSKGVAGSTLVSCSTNPVGQTHLDSVTYGSLHSSKLESHRQSLDWKDDTEIQNYFVYSDDPNKRIKIMEKDKEKAGTKRNRDKNPQQVISQQSCNKWREYINEMSFDDSFSSMEEQEEECERQEEVGKNQGEKEEGKKREQRDHQEKCATKQSERIRRRDKVDEGYNIINNK